MVCELLIIYLRLMIHVGIIKARRVLNRVFYVNDLSHEISYLILKNNGLNTGIS